MSLAFFDDLDDPEPVWVCPCPECNGAGPRWLDQFEDEDAMMEPEHPENVSPERQGYA